MKNAEIWSNVLSMTEWTLIRVDSVLQKPKLSSSKLPFS